MSSRPCLRDRQMTALVLCAVIAMSLLRPAVASDDIGRLIRQLGAEGFGERQDAHRQLLDQGPDVLPSLEAESGRSDPEVRARTTQLIDRLREVRNEALLSELLTTPLGPAPAGLPGWRAYAAITGDGLEARQLYRDMLRTQAELLMILEEESSGFSAELQARTDELYIQMYTRHPHRREEVSRADVAVLLLVSVEQDVSANSPLAMILPDMLDQTDIDLIPPEDGGVDDPLRQLLAAWIVTPHTANRLQRMSRAIKYNLAAGVQPARETLLDRDARDRERQDAVLVLARFGSIEHVADLEPLLQDATPLDPLRRSRRVQFQTRMQDLALAALLHLTGQNPKDYHLNSVAENAQTVFDPQSIGFEKDDDRSQALLKWRRWSAINLRSPLFGPLDAIEGTTL